MQLSSVEKARLRRERAIHLVVIRLTREDRIPENVKAFAETLVDIVLEETKEKK